jgi:antitoxin MazE
MQVSKWGNSLAVRFPASLVQALNLKEGEEIELHLLGERSLAVGRKDTPEQLLERLRALRGRLPADFHFDRQEAQER